ncbi:hypothetical protein PINS_up015543 [Pythium insidiosum]|nr:hypothetical protein PINS_up015543 [Pythium insidiosum]
MSSRQRRARMRKWWTRRVDVEGRVFWYRDVTADVTADGFVLQFGDNNSNDTLPHTHAGTSNRSDEDDESDDDTSDDPSHSADLSMAPIGSSTDLPSRSFDEVLSDVRDSIEDDIVRHPPRVLPSSDADGLRFPVLVTSALATHCYSVAERKQLVQEAQLVFPSKLAHFITRATTANAEPRKAKKLVLNVRREALANDSIQLLAGLSNFDINRRLRVRFNGGAGIDAGGVYREWFLLMCDHFTSPAAGVFRCVDKAEQVFFLNPHSREDLGENHLAHVYAAGRFLGRALVEGNVTGFHLALPLLKIILGQPLSFRDLEFFDPETYRNMKWLLENDGADALGLDFSVCVQHTDAAGVTHTTVAEMRPGGWDMAVTDDNKHDFVQRKFQYMVFDSVAPQLFALIKGIYEVVPAEILMLLDAEELDYILSGSDEIDVDDWERHTKYTYDLMKHPVRTWFWELVREMPNEHRRRLLQFATGSSRVPLAGFSALTSYDGHICPFTLNGVTNFMGGYIHSHACFNRLDLPRYTSRRKLKFMLDVIVGSNVEGFTTA